MKRAYTTSRSMVPPVIGVVLATMGTPAHAQSATSPAPEADIIVTANRREEPLQKVGVSVTATSGVALDQHNIRTSEDLARLVPGLNSTASSGSGVSAIIIRGVGETDFSDHQEQPNASYQDGIYIPFATAVGVPIFDMQRVEVLRGPQGTLFGRNATGGLIQYISAKPVAGFSGAIDGGIGDRDLYRVQGFVNGGTDKIAGRLAYFFQTQHGVIENTQGPDRGNKKVYALRGQISLKPFETTEILLRADGFNQYGTSPGYKATPSYMVGDTDLDLPADVDAYGTGPGNDPYGYRNPYKGKTVSLDEPGKLNKRSRTFAMTITQDLGEAKITSLSAYGKVNSFYVEDTDSSPIQIFDAGLKSHARDFQQDLRVNGSSGPFRYTLGGFFMDIDAHNSVYNIYYDPGQRNTNIYRVRTRSEAIYGQAEYDLGEKVTAILGGRYTWDQLKLNFANECTQIVLHTCGGFGGANSPVLATFPGITGLYLHNNHDDWSGKAQINFKPSNDILLYASASKGLKSAGYTVSLSPRFPVSSFTYEPEKLYAYEVGEKAQFFNKKLTINTSAYYYGYHKMQNFLFTGVSATVINLPAKAYGGELEITARPVRDLNFNLAAAYNHFEVKDVPFAPNGDPQRPINAPRLQLVWGITKTFRLSDDYSIDLNYFGRRLSKIHYNLLDNTPIIEAPAYDIHDFSIRLDAKAGWYVGAYLNNAFNKTYIVGAFDVTSFGFALRSYGEPRTVSATAGIKF